MANKIFENFENSFGGYQKALLTCVLASQAIYEEDPLESFNSENFNTFNHCIKKLIVSEVDEENNDPFSLQVKYMVCEGDKLLIVAFRGTKTMNDFLTDIKVYRKINDITGSFHSGIYQQSEKIPVDFFVEKIKNGYKVIFTGHSLGAAIAGMITIRVLYDQQFQGQEELMKNVLCIGFGSPAFFDDIFRNEVEKKFKKNFHFYINENDIVVDLLTTLSNEIYSEKFDKNMSELASCFLSFIASLKGNLSNDSSVTNLSILTKFSEYALRYVGTVVRAVVPNYRQFGNILYLNGHLKYSDYCNKISSIKNELEKYRKRPDVLITKIQNHYIGNYRRNIIELLSNPRINDKIKVDQLESLFIPSVIVKSSNEDTCNEASNNYSVKLVVNQFETDVILNLTCEKNAAYIANAFLNIENEKIATRKLNRRKNNSLQFIFSVSNRDIVTETNKLKKLEKFEVEIVSQFGRKNTKLNVECGDNDIERNEISYNKEQILKMPVDLLYIYAIFYVKTFKKIQNDENIEEQCNQILNCLNDLCKIWNIKSKSPHSFTEAELGGVFFSYFANDFNSEQLKLQTFSNKNFVSLKDNVNEEDMRVLIENVLPTCYYLKRLQSENYFRPWDHSAAIYFNFYSLIMNFLNFMQIKAIFWRNTSDEAYLATLDLFLGKKFKDCLPYLGFYEKKIVELENSGKFRSENDETKKNLLRTIKINNSLRNILSSDSSSLKIFGVIGKKKCGKSTFIERIIPGANANASANIATTVTTPYKINDSVILIDYPHFDSIQLSHKLQFLFSRFILDNTFLICAAIERMDSDDTMRLLELIKTGQNKNYTILLNRADDLWRDCRSDVIFAKTKFDELKKEVQEKRANLVLDNEDKILLTCLCNIANLEDQDGLKRSGVLLGEEIRNKILSIIGVTKAPAARSTEYKEKKILIQNERGSKEIKIIITNNKETCETRNKNESGYEIVDSPESLNDQISFFRINNPIYKLKYDPNVQCNSFDNLFDMDGQTFIIFERQI